MRHPAHPDFHRTWFNSVRHDPITAVAAATAAATALQAVGTIMSGNAERGAANFQAAQMHQQAGQERAASQRQAIEQRRQAGLANSRVTAVAAASGASATDPTVVNIEKDNAGAGEYGALSALYQGEERARGLDMGASAKVYEGQQARQAALFKAGGTILSSGNSMNQKYGNGGFEGTQSDYLRTGAIPGSYSEDPNAKLPWLSYG